MTRGREQAAELEDRPQLGAPLPRSDPAPRSRSLSICLICPKFQPSFFGLEYALQIMPGEQRSLCFPGALPLLAALVPEGHSVTLLDENVEELDFADLRRFDVIGITGMIVQKRRMDEILDRLAGAGPLICVGGPYVTVDEQHFAGKCDVIFVGEADQTWPHFLDDLAAGRPIKQRYAQEQPTDLSCLPVPRYDLLPTPRYYSGSTQFGRGCPYLCEFCDIIVIFGRKPRLKEPDQILSELDALLATGMRSVNFIDDNFIANRKATKRLLAAIIDWQERNGFPMMFSTEATIDLGDEPEILDLLWRAKFRSVFIGIESPRADSLLETRKIQNVRGDSLEAKLARVLDAGIYISAGFILGFDHDDEGIFDEQFKFIQRTGIGTPFVSILSPIPSTPLYERLQREGRLRPDDELVWFEPKRLSRERLKTGYHALNARLFEPAAFFDRIFRGQLRSGYQARRRAAEPHRRRSLMSRLREAGQVVMMARRLAAELRHHGRVATLGRAYLATWVRRNIRLGADRLRLSEYLRLCARHWHCARVTAEARSNWGT